MPERRIDQQRIPAGQSNITELRPAADRAGQASADFSAPALPPSGPDPAFWRELNATIDEFFAVIAQSRTRMAELSAEMARRDAQIALLEAQNGALRARLGIADAPPPRSPEHRPAPPSAPQNVPANPRGDRSIWSKLTNLERNGG